MQGWRDDDKVGVYARPTRWKSFLHCVWPQLETAVRVVGHRQATADRTSQPRYYIGSLAGSTEQLLAAIRGHRSIEDYLPGGRCLRRRQRPTSTHILVNGCA